MKPVHSFQFEFPSNCIIQAYYGEVTNKPNGTKPQPQLTTTVELIATIGAIVLAIASEVTVDAQFVLHALELIRAAGYVAADRRHLVITTWTILLAITDPAAMDAGDKIIASILERQARVG